MERTGRLQTPRGARIHRSRALRAVVIVLVAVLGTALFRLQVLRGEEYAVVAQNNRLRPVPVPAPRGTIYDRHGQVVAGSIPGYQVMLMPAPMDSMDAQLERLTPILGLRPANIERAKRKWSRQRHLPMIVLDDADPRAIARLEERRHQFPGVLVYEYAKRYYPDGENIAHMIGYVAEISDRELQEEFPEYQQGRWIGKNGLEKQYERLIGGTPGMRYLEIDARGRIKRWLPEEMGVPPIPGKDLHLYLDLDLQNFIAEIFPKEYTGSIVAIDPLTGGILAYYSHPTFDPNRFIGGIPTDYWTQLQEDEDKPLIDRVAGSGQPAASTWKLAVAGMALDLGVIEPDEYMPQPCTGGIFYGRYARCWLSSGHGRQNLILGIKNSCNVYFYQLGIKIGLERFLETGTKLGFGERTGIDLPTEISNSFPSGLEWYEDRFGYKPYDNEVLSLSIGQGPITMTVLKLAHIYSALTAPGGRVPAPRLAMESGAPRDTFEFHVDKLDQWYLEAGMRRVLGPGGTAALSRLQNWELLGKTGTAQNPHGPDHAWFVGTGAPEKGAPPEIAVTMFLEFAEHGYTASGYVAEAVNFYLDRKYGRPFQRWATPRLRFANGMPVNWNFSEPVTDPPQPSPSQAAAPSGGQNQAGAATTTASTQGSAAASRTAGTGPGGT
ncbi:MAG: penicillin-binding protein 2 [Longimicrobiales bacterium]